MDRPLRGDLKGPFEAIPQIERMEVVQAGQMLQITVAHADATHAERAEAGEATERLPISGHVTGKRVAHV